MILSPGTPVWTRRPCLLAAACVAALLAACGVGCGGPPPGHPAIGRAVGKLHLVSLADRSRPPPSFAGRVTLLNFTPWRDLESNQ